MIKSTMRSGCYYLIGIIISVQLCVDAVNVRLANGYTKYEGRVEVFYAGQWGTVCDDGWSLNDAQVVCNELGFGPPLYARIAAYYGQGSDPIWLDDVACTGSESSIDDCPHSGLGVHNCDHSEDASVECSPPVRLVNGATRYQGRVEVYYNGEWGTVCDDGWSLYDARVVCRQLGYYGGTAISRAHYGPGIGRIWLSDVGCRNTELGIEDCSHSGWGINTCDHNEDASVRCDTTPTTTTTGRPTGAGDPSGDDDDDDGGQSTAAIVGEVIGSIIGILLIIGCCYCLYHLITNDDD